MLNSFLKNTSEGYKTLQASEISLLPTFQDLSFDMFIISGFDRKKYISERLKEMLEKETITGIEINESKLSIQLIT